MTFLIIGNNKEHKYRVYCPEVYGFETWGKNYQEELLKKRKSWYFTYWSGGYDEEDCYEESKANVLFETKDVDEIYKYIESKCRDQIDNLSLKNILESITDDVEEIFRNFITIERWCLN